MDKKFYGPLVLMALLGMSSCHQNNTEESGLETDSTQIEDSVVIDSAYTDEDEVEPLELPAGRDEAFSDFIFSFIHNRRFQAERVKFPLKVTNLDGSESRIKSGEVFRKEFRLPSYEYYTVLLGEREQMEVFQNDLELADVNFDMIKLQNRQRKSFHFVRESGKWALIEEKHEVVNDHYADFLDFYQRFTTDSLYEQQSLASHIYFSTPDYENEMETVTGTIEASQWSAFRPEMPFHVITNIEFGQTFENPNKMLLLQCGISNGMMDVYTFHKEGGRWKLISYEN